MTDKTNPVDHSNFYRRRSNIICSNDNILPIDFISECRWEYSRRYSHQGIFDESTSMRHNTYRELRLDYSNRPNRCPFDLKISTTTLSIWSSISHHLLINDQRSTINKVTSDDIFFCSVRFFFRRLRWYAWSTDAFFTAFLNIHVDGCFFTQSKLEISLVSSRSFPNTRQ